MFVVDDLFVMGGIVEVCCNLFEKCGVNIVGCLFVIELFGLGGCDKIVNYDVLSLF